MQRFFLKNEKCSKDFVADFMIACIDAFGQSTSQANYFEGFWGITSKINAKIQVRKQ